MSRERRVLEVWDDGERLDDWGHWKKNYINVMADPEMREKALAHYEQAVIYLREPDSAFLSPALKIEDEKYGVTLRHEPADLRLVTFEGNRSEYAFRYSPSGGYEVPPPGAFRKPLTLDTLVEYQRYFTEGVGWQTLRKADFSGYRIWDKRYVDSPELKDAWAVTYDKEDGKREILMKDGEWRPQTDVAWALVNEYKNFTWKFKKAIDLIRGFTS